VPKDHAVALRLTNRRTPAARAQGTIAVANSGVKFVTAADVDLLR
jgi:hypothetical protein